MKSSRNYFSYLICLSAISACTLDNLPTSVQILVDSSGRSGNVQSRLARSVRNSDCIVVGVKAIKPVDLPDTDYVVNIREQVKDSCAKKFLKLHAISAVARWGEQLQFLLKSDIDALFALFIVWDKDGKELSCRSLDLAQALETQKIEFTRVKMSTEPTSLNRAETIEVSLPESKPYLDYMNTCRGTSSSGSGGGGGSSDTEGKSSGGAGYEPGLDPFGGGGDHGGSAGGSGIEGSGGSGGGLPPG